MSLKYEITTDIKNLKFSEKLMKCKDYNQL